MSRTALVLALAVTAGACQAEARPRGGPNVNERALTPPPKVSTTVRTESSSAAQRAAPQYPEFEYSEMLSAGARDTDALPLILVLHGLGDAPAHFIRLFEGFPCPARIVAPHSSSAYGHGYSWFRFQKEDLEGAAADIARRADELFRFAIRLSSDHRTVGRPLVTGFSQGGALSFAIAAEHGIEIAGAFPVGGWLPEGVPDRALGSKTAPITAFHGADDLLIAVSRPRAAVARLKKDGFAVELREFSEVGHEIPAVVRAALLERLAGACERERTGGDAPR